MCAIQSDTLIILKQLLWQQLPLQISILPFLTTILLLLLIIWANINAQSGQDRVNELIIQEKIVNKPNRNDDSYCVNESIVDFNIEQLEYSNPPKSDLSFTTLNTKQSSSIESFNIPKHVIINILETPKKI